MRDLVYLKSRSIEDPATGCWLWQGGTYGSGYGATLYAGKSRSVHRLAWALANNCEPTGLVIRHKCNNKLCCNPKHLQPGTQAQNIADRDMQQRQSRGSQRPAAKLTELQVLEIRTRYPNESQRALGKAFGVSQTIIKFIVNRKTWKHI